MRDVRIAHKAAGHLLARARGAVLRRGAARALGGHGESAGLSRDRAVLNRGADDVCHAGGDPEQLAERTHILNVSDARLTRIAHEAPAVVGRAHGAEPAHAAAIRHAAHDGPGKAARVTAHALGAEQAALVPRVGAHGHAVGHTTRRGVVDDGLERLDHAHVAQLEKVEDRGLRALPGAAGDLGHAARLGDAHKAAGIEAAVDAAKVAHRHVRAWVAFAVLRAEDRCLGHADEAARGYWVGDRVRADALHGEAPRRVRRAHGGAAHG